MSRTVIVDIGKGSYSFMERATLATCSTLRHVVLFLVVTVGMIVAFERAALAGDEWRYEAQIVGVEEESLLDALTAVSRTLSRQETPPATRRVLDRRLQDDVAHFGEVLRSEGYYQGKVEVDVGSGPPPIPITLGVDPGPPFLIGDFTVDVEAAAGSAVPPPRIEPVGLGLNIGDRARSAAIIDATERAIVGLGRKAYPFAAVAERKIVVDHSSRTVSILLRIDAGPFARFGAVRIEGLSSLDESYVWHRLGWREGEPFDQDKLEEARRKLVRSGLFESVKVARADKTDAVGRVSVTITARERPARSIGGGASYSTDLGPGIKGLWEHRNLFGAAERLNVTAALATAKQGLEGHFSKPDFPTASERLVIDADIGAEELDAFDSRTVRTSGRIEHSLSEQMMLAGGLGLERADIESQDDREQFTLVFTPLQFRYDTSDNPFEPTRGHRLDVGTTPYASASSDALGFAVIRLADAAYWSPTGDGSIVLAGRAALGALIGAETREVPATKRLYSGGGGSVRGYAFQSIGPLNARRDPVGGRSVVEFSLEARFRLWESYGVVPFLDAGSVRDTAVPEFDGDLQWGAGIGFRYYTPVGPVRLDVAVPLNRRREVDDAFQLYVNLGQAF